ncbi:hypothetical protein DKG77_10915 [Flagellimonas aquimarina]|uniref:DUF4249 domain-containing protein n=1 Tax=Flagellimonas aquimarina TaxID=2201895 RepID=A0A316L1E5_9FLAO|nr:DUF4249 domain-containing protein [Allomuricauda koreensis]PWL38749.1 hypothetical protein DKG77_10915 [Allomuricauda koreensis]
MGWLLCSCIEPFDTEFVDFEDAFVVDATITNQMKRQEIILTRTYRLQDDDIPNEAGARIVVTDDTGEEFLFEEVDFGKYISNVSFAALPERNYQLLITSRNGREYSSGAMRLPQVSTIDTLYANRITNDFGEEGIGIFVDTSNPSEDSNFYRYEYEETYKVIAPRWDPKELEVVDENDGTTSIIIIPRSLDEQVCYPTNLSKRIILTDTDSFDAGMVDDFMLKFIEQNNFITTHRYSILVRQFVHSLETYKFLETLNEFSTSESLFSETQPGFLEGNIAAKDDPDEKVLGFFDVTAISEKRIFFGYRDFFPTERFPDYIDPCIENAPDNGLIDLIRWDLVKYIDKNEGQFVPGGPYITVPQVCGDCTILGTSEVPDFWIE